MADSRIEQILEGTFDGEPESRVERILTGTYDGEPQSRVEALLMEGGAGSSDNVEFATDEEVKTIMDNTFGGS